MGKPFRQLAAHSLIDDDGVGHMIKSYRLKICLFKTVDIEIMYILCFPRLQLQHITRLQSSESFSNSFCEALANK